MIKIDLITGFLGSGKTTFIRKYAQKLIDEGKHIAILENDFGAVNIDMMVLADLEGPNCELEMVSGGCDKDCHIRRFKTQLISIAMRGFDRVIVEPSGIFDVDEFFDVLREEPLERWYEIGNVLAIVDANLSDELSAAGEYLLASQIACAGKIVLSKVQSQSTDQQEKTIAHMQKSLARLQCKRNISGHILAKDWEQFSEEDYQLLFKAGYVAESFVKLILHEDENFDSIYLWNVALEPEELKEKVAISFEDPSLGQIHRIKGFLPKAEGGWWKLNATRDIFELIPVAAGQQVLIAIGEKLQEEKMKALWKSL